MVEPALVRASEVVQARQQLARFAGVHLGPHRRLRDAGKLVDARVVVLGRGRLLERGLGRMGRASVRPERRSGDARQQIVVAERIRASVGLGAWGCAKTLGLTRR
jgi:hypothetical protein